MTHRKSSPDRLDIPLQIKQQLDGATYQTLVSAFIACEKAGEAAGYARAMRDCTAALSKIHDNKRNIFAREPIIGAAIIILASLGVTAAYVAEICRF